jgi:hypothetical protein
VRIVRIRAQWQARRHYGWTAVLPSIMRSVKMSIYTLQDLGFVDKASDARHTSTHGSPRSRC